MGRSTRLRINPGPRRSRTAFGLTAVVLAVLVSGCGGQPDPAAWRSANLFVVVTRDGTNTLVGIETSDRKVSSLARLEAAPDGPPISVTWPGSTLAHPLLWTQALNSNAVTLREVDRVAGRLADRAMPSGGVLPVLIGGDVAWATPPGEGSPRLDLPDGRGGRTQVSLPGIPSFLVAGPGPARVTGIVDVQDRGERIETLDIASARWSEIPTEDGLSFGGLSLRGDLLIATVRGRRPTGATSSLEADDRALVWQWSSTAGSANGGWTSSATLHPGPAPTVGLITGDWFYAAIGAFDHPRVAAIGLGGAPADPRHWDVVPGERIVSIAADDRVVTILQERHVTFIDPATGASSVLELPGESATIWQ